MIKKSEMKLLCDENEKVKPDDGKIDEINVLKLKVKFLD